MNPKTFYIKAKQKLSWKLNDLLVDSGLKRVSIPKNPFQSILVYHGVDKSGNTDYNSRFISESELDKQFAFFKQNFHIISLDEYYKNNFHPSLPTIAITFDDGYANNYSRALPLLEKHKLPATFFITTIRDAKYDILWPDCLDLSVAVCKDDFKLNGEHFFFIGKQGYVSKDTKFPLKETAKNYGFQYKIDLMNSIPGHQLFRKDKAFDEYWNLLTEEEIKKLGASPLVTIGSHGYYHNCLERIPIQDAEEELIKSKKYLENILQKEVSSLAFPDGSFSDELVKCAEKIGFIKQLSTKDHLSKEKESAVLKTRFVMNHHLSLYNQVRAIIKNTYY